ncbi:NAD-binding protein [Brasilonema sp. UFV-L1]|uniref:NAD-binding protein n=1 Tax=Brasilonema sp. UFV-L1 TaxID=2234130 RepID=UPI002006ED74|nr:NAD-binding protein [Brasilonema sp. UFV-L1]
MTHSQLPIIVMSHPFTETDVVSAVQTETPRAHFLVCGLGSLGQYCVAKLKEFGVSVSAIDVALPSIWEISNIPDLLQELVIGDCRQPDVLIRANIQQSQAVLIVTSNERVNIDTAFAVRVVNQYVRLVIRSSKQNLNKFLDRSLGNFEALEATQLTVSAFAIAALGSEIQGLINLNEHMLSVVKCQITVNHRWCDRPKGGSLLEHRRLVYELNNRHRRVISHISDTANPDSTLVIRTFDPRFSNNLARILPSAEVLCVYSLAAEAFAAAAFGENILNLFRLHDQTILVAEYNIQSDDPLCGLLLAEVAYGYGMMPVLYQKSSQFSAELMPSDDTQLKEGDRLVVLQTINSLQRLERGEIIPLHFS